MKIIKNLCIIPARAGSKRIPNKNIKEFCGKPIISYSIQKALNSKIFDKVIVSTDSEKIKEISINFGAEVPFIRKNSTSNDFATIYDVILEVVQFYKAQDTIIEKICIAFSTIPLLDEKYFKILHDLLNKDTIENVFTIKKFRHPIERALGFNLNNNLYFIDKNNCNIRTQDFSEKYYDAGQLYFGYTDSFLIHKNLIGEKNNGVILKFLESVDIDNEDDWELAEIIFKNLNYNNNDIRFKS